ncbi:MAG: MurR/RpiR family transcriptional regulator [Gemmobacter sp.]|nr:MurR/RpiR family transcriptional regulator [Gemmobacter sp.]
MPDQPFLTRLRGALQSLHPAERKLGDLLADFPGELASYSASELARLAGVSNATVTRFIRKLGYDSYEEARRHAREGQESGSRLFLAHPGGTSVPDLAASYAERDSENLRRTLDGLDMGAINSLATALLGARRVWLIGYRAGHPFATYMQWQLTQVIEDVVAIPGGGQTMGEHFVSIRPTDVMIVFGLRRRVAQMEDILTLAEDSGAALAYITDEGAPRRKGAKWHFHCHTSSVGPLFSHTAVMGLCNLIANQTIELAAQAGRARLASIERFNDALGEL